MTLNELDFPDTGLRLRGQITRQTVEAMRAAKGDRRLAAQQLGIDTNTLAKRLQTIRAKRDALK
jgi:DNA-binding NtrC family response regulator